MMVRIAMGGKAGAGKDHVLKIITSYYAGRDGIVRLSGYGDLVRKEWSTLHRSGPPTRWDLQEHGRKRRLEDPDYWTKKAAAWADGFREGLNIVLGFSGVRFLNEIQILQRAGFMVGLVTAKEEDRRHRLFHRDGRWWTEEELRHPTELALDEIPDSAWNFFVRN